MSLFYSPLVLLRIIPVQSIARLCICSYCTVQWDPFWSLISTWFWLTWISRVWPMVCWIFLLWRKRVCRIHPINANPLPHHQFSAITITSHNKPIIHCFPLLLFFIFIFFPACDFDVPHFSALHCYRFFCHSFQTIIQNCYYFLVFKSEKTTIFIKGTCPLYHPAIYRDFKFQRNVSVYIK